VASDVLHDRDGTLADEHNRHRVRADAVARDAAGGVGRAEQGDMNGSPDPLWLARLQALGKLQARYLWLLVVASVFYFGLSSGTLRPTNGDVKVPVLDLELGVASILAGGPVVLSFLVLVVIGALKAYRRASEQLGIDPADPRAEATDAEPNFLDMAFYSMGSTRPVLRHIPHVVQLKYPVFLSAVLLQAGNLLRHSTPSVVGVMGVIVWFVAVWQVAWYWHRRFRSLWPKRF